MASDKAGRATGKTGKKCARKLHAPEGEPASSALIGMSRTDGLRAAYGSRPKQRSVSAASKNSLLKEQNVLFFTTAVWRAPTPEAAAVCGAAEPSTERPSERGMDQGGEDRRAKVLADYRKTLLQHKEVDAKVRLTRRCGRLGCHQ